MTQRTQVEKPSINYPLDQFMELLLLEQPAFAFKIFGLNYQLKPNPGVGRPFKPRYGFEIYLDDEFGELWFESIPWRSALQQQLGGTNVDDLHEKLLWLILHEAINKVARHFQRQTGIKCHVEHIELSERNNPVTADTLPLVLQRDGEQPVRCEWCSSDLSHYLPQKMARLRDMLANRVAMTGTVCFAPIEIPPQELKQLEPGDIVLLTNQTEHPRAVIKFTNSNWLEGTFTENYLFQFRNAREVTSEETTESMLEARIGLKKMKIQEMEGLKKGDLLELPLAFPLKVDLWLAENLIAIGTLVKIADRLGIQIIAVGKPDP